MPVETLYRQRHECGEVMCLVDLIVSHYLKLRDAPKMLSNGFKTAWSTWYELSKSEIKTQVLENTEQASFMGSRGERCEETRNGQMKNRETGMVKAWRCIARKLAPLYKE
jgi:hypothetical protein